MVAAGLTVVITAGCAAINNSPDVVDASGNPVGTLIPNKFLQITSGVSLSAEHLVLGAALYWFVDPLAPNWRLQQVSLGADRVRIALRKKRFSSGGDGEAAQQFERRAAQIARDGGYASYSVMEYTEGIESTLPLSERIAQGVIQLKR